MRARPVRRWTEFLPVPRSRSALRRSLRHDIEKGLTPCWSSPAMTSTLRSRCSTASRRSKARVAFTPKARRSAPACSASAPPTVASISRRPGSWASGGTSPRRPTRTSPNPERFGMPTIQGHGRPRADAVNGTPLAVMESGSITASGPAPPPASPRNIWRARMRASPRSWRAGQRSSRRSRPSCRSSACGSSTRRRSAPRRWRRGRRHSACRRGRSDVRAAGACERRS